MDSLAFVNQGPGWSPRPPKNAFFGRCVPVATVPPGHHECWNLARIGGICLECAAIFRHLPLTIRCRLGTIQER